MLYNKGMIKERQYCCCFTGHRPEKLNISEAEVIAWLEMEIHKAIDEGFVTFISGMARGVDIWAAEIILKLKEEGKNINLVCAVPFEGFEKNWSEQWKNRYRNIMRKADMVKFICKNYNKSCFQIRNIWMVNNSALVIAVFNGEFGGTKNTINYAIKNGVKVVCNN